MHGKVVPKKKNVDSVYDFHVTSIILWMTFIICRNFIAKTWLIIIKRCCSLNHRHHVNLKIWMRQYSNKLRVNFIGFWLLFISQSTGLPILHRNLKHESNHMKDRFHQLDTVPLSKFDYELIDSYYLSMETRN